MPNSELLALLGLDTCRQQRAIIDTNKNKMYLVGPADYDLEQLLPAGTECIDLEVAPSGHLVIPCAEFDSLDAAEKRGGLVLEKEVALPVSTSSSSQ